MSKENTKILMREFLEESGTNAVEVVDKIWGPDNKYKDVEFSLSYGDKNLWFDCGIYLNQDNEDSLHEEQEELVKHINKVRKIRDAFSIYLNNAEDVLGESIRNLHVLKVKREEYLDAPVQEEETSSS